MASINSARDRAETIFQDLQKRARELLDAEAGLAKSVSDLIEKNGLAPAEAKKKLEELVGNLSANKLWARIVKSDAAVALSDYRDEVERRAQESMQRLIEALPVANKSGVASLEKQVAALSKRVNELAKKLES